MRFSRIAAAAAATVLLVGSGALLAPANAVQPAGHGAAHVKAVKIGGSTTVVTDPGIANAVLGAGLVVLAGTPGSTTVRGALTNPALAITFPVTGANLTRGTVNHRGSLIILNPSKGKAVTLGDLRIDLKAGTISGKLNGGAYAPAFRIDASKAKVVNNRAFVRYSNVGVLLNTGIAGVLNTALETTAFTEGLRIGTATVNVTTKR